MEGKGWEPTMVSIVKDPNIPFRGVADNNQGVRGPT